ncbi:hypothetical protein ROZALSC1DRAFT_25410 [Rozella allomycis CSF55]|uniref:Uncharacterized protein n=1 Tax=Rozella allomycis (strain CSF55) TaxID=988480 RepID=A0A4P9YCL1_ROZAC|nr:hypothetical protein ROZALSC1DRAFT_25410 [Rozella allomycis CSF55]
MDIVIKIANEIKVLKGDTEEALIENINKFGADLLIVASDVQKSFFESERRRTQIQEQWFRGLSLIRQDLIREMQDYTDVLVPVRQKRFSQAGGNCKTPLRSIYQFIHSKRRNRLSIEKVEKLAFIYINQCLLDSMDSRDYIGNNDSLSEEK